MSASPRTVAAETWITWDGVPQRLARGQVMDVTPGSALEAAIGRERLVPLRGATAALQVNSVEPGEAVEAAPKATLTHVLGAGGGGAAPSVTAGGGGGGEYKVTPVSPPVSRTVGSKQDDGKDGEP